LLVFIADTVNGSRRCSTRCTNVWCFSGSSQPEYGRTGKQDGVSNWEVAKADEVSHGKLSLSYRLYTACKSTVSPRYKRFLLRSQMSNKAQLENMTETVNTYDWKIYVCDTLSRCLQCNYNHSTRLSPA